MQLPELREKMLEEQLCAEECEAGLEGKESVWG